MSKYKGKRAISLFVGVLLCMALIGNASAAWNTPDWNTANWNTTNWDNTNWDTTKENSTTQNVTSENTIIWNSTDSSNYPSDITKISKFADLMKSIPRKGK
jgi:hypothetical protein